MTSKYESELDAKVAKFERKVEAGVVNWVRTDSAFNFLRGTAARFVLAILSLAVLYGFGWFAFWHPGGAGYYYPGLIVVVVMLQKLSLRFVFDDDSIIDEYQHKRRNRAYRRAYKRVALIIAVAIAVVVIERSTELSLTSQSAFWPLPNGRLALSFSTYQVYVALVWLLGLFTIQKYLSWGFRGEAK
jgi:hypothetical protein